MTVYSLKNLPECYMRPAPPKPARWIIALAIILMVSVIFVRIFGRYIENRSFWLIALGVPVSLWSTAVIGRLVLWMLKDIKANGYDKRREKWILSETRRARRALQVLNVSFVTGHTVDDQPEVVNAMLRNTSIVTSQTDWQGKEGVRMSRISAVQEDKPELLIASLFSQLITKLSEVQFPEKISLAVAFDFSSSIPRHHLLQLWEKAWQESEISLPVEYLDGSGLDITERWLDTRVKDNTLLLVVALQILPFEPANSAEAVVALLFGNRLTQEILEPLALLHRPDSAVAKALEAGMRMAAYNVPVKENIVKHLWLAGLNERQYADVVLHQKKHPTQSVANEGVINLDLTMGNAGTAAPWLAIAAATEAAQQTQSPQMIICGDTTQDVLWSTLVTPIASRQEMDS